MCLCFSCKLFPGTQFSVFFFSANFTFLMIFLAQDSCFTNPVLPCIYILTRVKTSKSSKAFCSITDRQTDKIFTEQMIIYEGNLHTKNQGPKKSRFSLNLTDIQTYLHTDILTDGHLLLQSSFATKNLLSKSSFLIFYTLFLPYPFHICKDREFKGEAI